jgi:hypothetical protein
LPQSLTLGQGAGQTEAHFWEEEKPLV